MWTAESEVVPDRLAHPTAWSNQAFGTPGRIAGCRGDFWVAGTAIRRSV